MGSTESARGAGRSSRGASPARSAERESQPTNHGDLWEHINGLREDVGELKGQVKVILAIAGATFAVVFALAMAQIFS